MDNDKKKTVLMVIMIAVFSFLFIYFYNVHIYCAMDENPELNYFTAMGAAAARIGMHPLKIFPLPMKAFGTTMILLLVSGVIALFIFLNAKSKFHYDKDTAMGDAHWMTQKELDEYNRTCTEPFGSTSVKGFNNVILADKFYLSMDNEKTNLTCNQIVIAGSGRGKSFRFVTPNILQANASFLVTDPSGSLYRSLGNFLECKGYKVKCLNLSKMYLSNHYNPFDYIHSDKDIMVLVDTLIANTTPPESHSSEPFWEKAEANLLGAVIALQHHYLGDEFKNFSATLNLIRKGSVSENGGMGEDNELAQLFNKYEKDDPNGYAFKQFGSFKISPAKTLNSILISCAFRIKGFDLEDVKELTSTDDIELDNVGDEKTAIFVIIPTGESTFNFIAAMFYSQMFIRMYDYCENTARFSQVIRDQKGELIKTFRAESAEDAIRVNGIAARYVDAIKNAVIKYSKQHDWYEIRTPKNKDGTGGELITYRRFEEDAAECIESLKTARICSNGEMLPIHTRFMLDEYANTGHINAIETKQATCRKYNISICIVLQSIKQLQTVDKDYWDSLTMNSDNICFMGGGYDKETESWLESGLGEETRQVASESFSSRNGSMSINSQGVKLFAAYQLRTLKDKEMIILPNGRPPFRGKMYNTLKHPNWHYVKDLPKYEFSALKTNYLIQQQMLSEFKTEVAVGEEKHGGVIQKTEEEHQETEKKNEELNKFRKQKADEIGKGKSESGEEIISEPEKIDKDGNSVSESLGIKNQSDLQKAAESFVMINRNLGSIYTVYEKAPIDRKREK